MPKEGSNAFYRAYADRWYLDRANRDTYLSRQAAADILTSGHLYLPTKLVRGLDTPSADGDAARKKYVDDLVALYLALAGGTMSGNIAFSGAQTVDGVDISAHAVNYILHNLTVRKSAAETVNNSATLQNDDELLFAIAANEVWEINLLAMYTSGTTPDIKFAFTGPSGATLRYTYAPYQAGWSPYTGGQAMTADGADATVFCYCIKGIAINGSTAGNVQLQWAQNVANASDTIVLANSFIIARRLI